MYDTNSANVDPYALGTYINGVEHILQDVDPTLSGISDVAGGVTSQIPGHMSWMRQRAEDARTELDHHTQVGETALDHAETKLREMQEILAKLNATGLSEEQKAILGGARTPVDQALDEIYAARGRFGTTRETVGSDIAGIGHRAFHVETEMETLNARAGNANHALPGVLAKVRASRSTPTHTATTMPRTPYPGTPSNPTTSL